jgi:glycosyltransferase involved in cell wall biosynthesis
MKILIVQPWIRLGGAELCSINLAYHLQRLGHHAPIACLFYDPTGLPRQAGLVEYLLPPKRLSRLFSRSRIAFLVLGPLFLAGLVWRHSRGAAVINPHEFPTTWVSVLVGTVRHIPVIWTSYGPPRRFSVADLNDIGVFDWLGWLFASSFLDRVLVRLISAVYVPSQKSRCQVMAAYSREAMILPPGIDSDFYGAGDGERALAKYALQGRFVLLCVGKLHPQENQVVCIYALREILADIPNAILVIAGDGPMTQRLRTITSEIGVEKHVVFVGHVPSWEIRDLYRACAIHLYPPIDESWGSVPFEALSAGRVSIVSSDSGAAEVFGRERLGVVCEPTVDGFANQIVRLYRNPDMRCQLARRGQEFVRQNLAWESHAEGFLKIVGSVKEMSSHARTEGWEGVEDAA